MDRLTIINGLHFRNIIKYVCVVGKDSLKLESLVRKIEKLETCNLESCYQVGVYECNIQTLESSFQHNLSLQHLFPVTHILFPTTVSIQVNLHPYFKALAIIFNAFLRF